MASAHTVRRGSWVRATVSATLTLRAVNRLFRLRIFAHRFDQFVELAVDRLAVIRYDRVPIAVKGFHDDVFVVLGFLN